jgi:hypothetical protein
MQILFLVAPVHSTTTCCVGASARVDYGLGLFGALVPVHDWNVTAVNDEGVANTTADAADVNALVKDADSDITPDNIELLLYSIGLCNPS